MRRSDAARRHRRSVAIIAAMAGVIVVLLATVAPWAEARYDARGLEPSPAARAIFRVAGAVGENLGLVLLLVAALIGLLWTSFGLLDRSSSSRSGA